MQILLEKLKQTDCGVSQCVSSVQRRAVKRANETGEQPGIDTGAGACERGWDTSLPAKLSVKVWSLHQG